MSIPKYRCSQSALYLVSNHILQSVSNNLLPFTEFKAKYTADYFVLLRNKLAYAVSLNDYQGRYAESENDFIHLTEAFRSCSNHWQTLKRYIKATYPSTEQKQQLEQAGSSYYKQACRKDWDAARSLLMSAHNFINKQNIQLSIGNNMPATFPAKFTIAHTNFSRQMLIYRQSVEKARKATINNMAANNELFKDITEICLDGQRIFWQQPALRTLFTFSCVLKIIAEQANTSASQSNDTPTDTVTSSNSSAASS